MSDRARHLLLLAAACGAVHAAFSLYWALGGRWLVATVGQWAVDWAERAPLTAGLVLAGVAAAKVTGIVVPWLAAGDRLPWSRGWRALSRAGAVVLIGYGTVNALGAWAVLAGLVSVTDPETAALVGHAVLWDPLFVAWGAFLLAGLRRPGTHVDGAVPADDPEGAVRPAA